MQTYSAVEQNKNVKWTESCRISPVGEEKVCSGNGLFTSVHLFAVYS